MLLDYRPCTNLGCIAILEDIQIWSQSAGLDNSMITSIVIRIAEQYVVPDGLVSQPWRLSSVGDRVSQAELVDLGHAFCHDNFPAERRHLTQQSHLADIYECDATLRRMVSQTHQECGFATCSWTGDDGKLTLWEHDINVPQFEAVFASLAG